MTIQRQVVLECVNPAKGNNKYYEINIVEMGSVYKVDCRWGRIEHFKDGNPQKATKRSHVNWNSAMAAVGSIVNNKLKKGYSIVKDSASIHKDVHFTSKSQEKHIKIQTNQKEFDRTEHVEIIVSDWWQHDTIEERAV